MGRFFGGEDVSHCTIQIPVIETSPRNSPKVSRGLHRPGLIRGLTQAPHFCPSLVICFSLSFPYFLPSNPSFSFKTIFPDFPLPLCLLLSLPLSPSPTLALLSRLSQPRPCTTCLGRMVLQHLAKLIHFQLYCGASSWSVDEIGWAHGPSPSLYSSH